jgi:hypothetical protein
MSQAQSRIRNGTQIVDPETFPFLIAIAEYISDDPAKYEIPFCTGSILSKKNAKSNLNQDLSNVHMLIAHSHTEKKNFKIS